MRWQFKPPVERVKHGYRINVPDTDRHLLLALMSELRDLLTGPADAPALRRIFPAAYHLPEHAEHDAEYQRLMRDDLVASRLSGMDIVEKALGQKGPLDEAQLLAFAQALNGIRLVLGTVLDVGEDIDPDDVSPDHPLAAEHHLYSFLSWLLEWTIRALQGT